MSSRDSFETEKNLKRRKAREAFRRATNKPAVVPGNKVMNNINKVNAILKEKVRLKGKETGHRNNYNKYNISYWTYRRSDNPKSRVRNDKGGIGGLKSSRKIDVLPSRVKPLVTRPALPNNVQNRILKKKEALEYVNDLINEKEKDSVPGYAYNTVKERDTAQLSSAIAAPSLVPIRKMRAGMQRQKMFKNKLVAFLTNDSVKMSHDQKLKVVKRLFNKLYIDGGLGIRPKNRLGNYIVYNDERWGLYDMRNPWKYRTVMQSLNLLKKPEDFDEVHRFYELALLNRPLDKNNLPIEFYPKLEEGRTFMSMPPNKRRHILNVMKKIKNSNGAAREDAMIEYQKHFLNRGKMVTLLKQRKRAGLNREIRNYKKEHGKKRKLPERFENERSKIARIGNLPSSTLKNMMNSLKHNP